jgi:hypothetical protein
MIERQRSAAEHGSQGSLSNSTEVMMEQHTYVIISNRNRTIARLAWTSPSTGLIYCGICMRATVSLEIGSKCDVCSSTVSRTFSLSEGKNTLKSAWSEAFSPIHSSDEEDRLNREQ